MKTMLFALLGSLVLAGCDSDDEPAASSGPRTCAAAAVTSDTQPDRTSIENLFGCVTFTYTPDNGDAPVSSSVVFSENNERDPILGGRTVGATSGFTQYLCAELILGDDDFICASSFLSTLGRYELTMNSQFEGSGTYQLCLGSLLSCNLEGSDFPIEPATIQIARGATLTKSRSDMGQAASQAHVQRSNETTISALEKNLVFRELLSDLQQISDGEDWD